MTKSRNRRNTNTKKNGRKCTSAEEHFQLVISNYTTKRKALAKDKEGIRIEISSYNEENFALNTNKRIGKHSFEVLSSQLIENQNILRFKCSVYNDRKESILLTTASLLDACSLTSCYDEKSDWMKTNGIVQIESKMVYDHIIIKFQFDEPVICSYQIPFALNLRKEGEERNITICRTILLNIVDTKKEYFTKEKEVSPFTDKYFSYNHLKKPRSGKFREDNAGSKGANLEWTGQGNTQNDVLDMLERMYTKKTTEENYVDKFHNCLWLEEIVNRKMLQKYNMENVRMTVHGDKLKLKVPGLEQKRPKLLVRQKLHVAVHNDHTAYIGYIHALEKNYIYIEKIDSILLKTISMEPYIELDVSFQLNELPLERAHLGVEGVKEKNILKSLFNAVLRSPQVAVRNFNNFLNKDVMNNIEQRTAVENILNCTSGRAPYIVYGPPGTGKTVTIVEAIYQILKHTTKKILVCAPANAACDMLTTKLIKFCKIDQLIRIHSKARDHTTIPEEIRPYSNYTDEEQIDAVSCEELLGYRIVVTTLILIGRYSNINEPSLGYEADYVFIDEAAQATEPDTCIALAMMKSKGNIVLAGDPKQLGPIVLSTDAQEYGLEMSLLERLMTEQKEYVEKNPLFITMLKNNFRSHPDILYLPNKLFYGNKLKAVSEEAQNHPVSMFDVYSNIEILQTSLKKGNKRPHIAGRAVEFIGVSSKERREGRSPSYYNEPEAIMVIECVKTLVKGNFIFKIEPCDIGVISPYIRQVYKITELLQQNNFKDVEVGSTESFQGREKRVIIISTVRAKHDLLRKNEDYNLGFVKHSKRFNVALTRAMSKLIVVGCPAVLTTDSQWRGLLKICIEKGSYHGFPLEERNKDKMKAIVERLEKFAVFIP